MEITSVRQDEINLIGSALRSDKVIDSDPEELRGDHFQDETLGRIWQSLQILRSKGKSTRLSYVVAECPDLDRNALEVCKDAIAVPLGFEAYARRIRRASERRRVIESVDRIRSYAQDIQDEDEFRTTAFDELVGSFGGDLGGGHRTTLEESAREAVNRALVAMKRGGGVSGTRTGFSSLDEPTTGLHAGDLVVLAARPGMGKTTLALNIAFEISKSKRVVFFSLEMPGEHLAGKILATEAGLGAQDLQKGRIAGRAGDLKNTVDGFAASSFTIFDSSIVTLGYLRSRLHQIAASSSDPIGLVVVDYLQLMSADSSKGRTREQEVSAMSRGLKILARDFACPIMVLSQLNRSVESRTDKRPLLSDLRESGAIEQDADMVWFIYRGAYYDDRLPPNDAELIIAKQRRGPICKIDLNFDGNRSRFSEADRRSEFGRY